jgi:hypothetical protein
MIHFSSQSLHSYYWKIKSQLFLFLFLFFFLLLTFDGGGGFYELIDSWKIEEGRIFSLTRLTFFFFHSHYLTLSLSQIKLLFYSYILTLVINLFNRIDLDFTVPKYSLIQPRSCLTSLSLTHSLIKKKKWLMRCATWLGLFFCPFFRLIY